MPDSIREAIRRELDDVRTIDPHCHLRPTAPAADTLADIVLYHHVWIELVSSGMPVHEVTAPGLPHELVDPGIPPDERVRRSLKHLGAIANTTVGTFLRWILKDLYGIDGGLTERNVDEACSAVERTGRDPHWSEEVLRRRCGIDVSVTVEGGADAPSAGILRGREWAPFNLERGKQGVADILEDMESDFGRQIVSSKDYVEFLEMSVDKLGAQDIRFVGFWLSPQTTFRGVTAHDVDTTLEMARRGEALDPGQIGRFAYFGATTALEFLKKTRVRTIQVIAGADVLPPHRSITSWDGALPGALGRIAGAFEDFHFNLSSASDAYTQDIGILAKHVPNVSVAGHWWHTFYPLYIRKSVETRIDMVPMNKIVAFFSDAYHCEWCYPKLRMVKQVWEDVLAERVARGWLDLDAATALVRNAFHENPKRIYGVS